MKRLVSALILVGSGIFAAPPGSLLDTLASELDRNFAILKEKADPAAYFISYEVTDLDSHSINATLGDISGHSDSHTRYLDVGLRVGTPKLDNYHLINGAAPQYSAAVAIPIDGGPDAVRQLAWIETDRAYRAAAERLIKIKTSEQVKVAALDKSDDFSPAPVAHHVEPLTHASFAQDLWTTRMRDVSAVFRAHPKILSSGVSISAQVDERYFVNSEGTRVQHGRGFSRVMISASARANDGMNLGNAVIYDAVDASRLPSEAVMKQDAEKLAEQVESLLSAPVAEPYVGPAIFSGRASGVFFHEIFGHRIEGHRQKNESEGQTFTKSVGEPVLPSFLSVVFDPTVKQIAGIDLNGFYDYDDEGVAARPVTAVDKGILKSFLMSRTPISGFDASNSHGRRQPGYEVVSRQSNLIVKSDKTVSDAQLGEMLLAEVRRQNKPYGLFFEDITSGYTTTQRAGMQAFKVIPVIVYRIYADGRPDELIRGADMVGTPLASFNKILATSDRTEVFNGYCGAESGFVPVAVVSPAILVSEIEIEKMEKSQNRPPLLPPPPMGPGAGQ
jgi:predicted Zn-dependent protease